MSVAELIDELSKYDQNATVYMEPECGRYYISISVEMDDDGDVLLR